jgi:hypothetical protein
VLLSSDTAVFDVGRSNTPAAEIYGATKDRTVANGHQWQRYQTPTACNHNAANVYQLIVVFPLVPKKDDTKL